MYGEDKPAQTTGGVLKEPVFTRICAQIEHRLDTIREAGSRLDIAVERLLGTTPQPIPSKSAENLTAPEPRSLEARLLAYIRQMECISDNLHATANRLDSGF